MSARTETERRYTVAEIDEMRKLLEQRHPATWPILGSSDFETDQRYRMVDLQMAAARSKIIEEELRTYMLAGIDPDELCNQSHTAVG